MKRIRLKKIWTFLLPVMLVAGMLVAPASAYTRNTLQAIADYFIFEDGIIDADWTKIISHVTEDGALTTKGTVYYRPTIYIPLGSKISLTEKAVDQEYRMAIGQDNVAVAEGLTSYVFSSEKEMQVVIYTPDQVHDGGFYYDIEIYVVGVTSGVATDLLTPFTDISYFDEPYHIKGPYNMMYWLTITEEQRQDIEWTYFQGFLSETSETTFSPFKSVTRAQVATVLWTYAGKPEPKNLNKNPFTDIKKSDPYYKAVLWAYEQGLLSKYVTMTSTFKPNMAADQTEIIDGLKKMFDCELENIRDGESSFKQLLGGCTRVNFAHYLHFTHKYVTSDTSITPTTPDSPVTSTEPDISTGFTDVKSDDYFIKAVQWAVEQNITAGTSATTFSPSMTCNRAQILTFLWHANGSPEPTAANPFADIQTGDYFYKAALWAAEKGLVSGSTFGANTDCTRAMTVEYMWKAAGSPAPAGKADFDDVPANADYAQAVAWAVEKNITSGTGDGTFSPAETCTRGQIVTFLYRAMGK